jgi:hypothetical protein
LHYLGDMNATKNLLTNLCNLLVCACEAFRYGLTFLRAVLCSRAVLAAKLLTVKSQLAACKQRIDSNKRPRSRFTASFRLLWVVLSKSLDRWEDLAQGHLERLLKEFIEEYYLQIARVYHGPTQTPKRATGAPQVDSFHLRCGFGQPSVSIISPIMSNINRLIKSTYKPGNRTC